MYLDNFSIVKEKEVITTEGAIPSDWIEIAHAMNIEAGKRLFEGITNGGKNDRAAYDWEK